MIGILAYLEPKYGLKTKIGKNLNQRWPFWLNTVTRHPRELFKPYNDSEKVLYFGTKKTVGFGCHFFC